jgi:hypothetical protein
MGQTPEAAGPVATTGKTLVVSSKSRIVLHVAGAQSPSMVVGRGGAVLGSSGSTVSASSVVLGGQDIGALIAEAPNRPGIDPAVPLRPVHIADGSIGLDRLQPLPISKGGTGRTSFPAGEVVLSAAGEDSPAGGVLYSDPRLRWDDAAKELVVTGGLSIGGVAFSP